MLPVRTSACPTDLDLEGHLQVPDLRLQAHVAGCRRCAGWIAEARAVGERFDREVAPYHLQRVLRALQEEQPRGFRLRLRPFLVAGSVAAMAGMAMLVLPQQAPETLTEDAPVLCKGEDDCALKVFVRRGSQEVRAAVNGQQVAPGDALRFTVIPRGPRFVLVFSVDATGGISRLYTGDEPIALPTTLPGSAELDSVPGPERIFAVLSSTRVSWAEVERAVTRALPGPGDEALRGLQELPIPGTEQATLLLERSP
jgi:hypothetical protein